MIGFILSRVARAIITLLVTVTLVFVFIRFSGDPAVGRHGLQVEISRRIYMDEARLQKGADYAAAKDLFTGLIAELRQFAADCPPGRAA